MLHSTNYRNTLIQVSDDCPAKTAKVPDNPATAAGLAYAMIAQAPYALTSDDVVFGVFAERRAILGGERDAAREAFFSKGQPCLRASPLVKSYGWGIHSDADGRVALVAIEDRRYAELLDDPATIVVKGMRNAR